MNEACEIENNVIVFRCKKFVLKRTDMAEKMDENITHMLADCDRNSFIDIFMGKCVVFKDRGKNCFTCYHDSAFGNVCP